MHGNRIGTGDGSANPVTLSPMCAAFVRRLLFSDLADLARKLAEEASKAAEPGPGISGGDAEATLRVLLGSTAEVLDAVGWDASRDDELLVEIERAQRAGSS